MSQYAWSANCIGGIGRCIETAFPNCAEGGSNAPTEASFQLCKICFCGTVQRSEPRTAGACRLFFLLGAQFLYVAGNSHAALAQTIGTTRQRARDLGQLAAAARALMMTTPASVTPTSLRTKVNPSWVEIASCSEVRIECGRHDSLALSVPKRNSRK